MKTIGKIFQEIGGMLLLLIILLALSYFLFADKRTEDERQLQEMIGYHHSQGREIIVFE